MTANALGRRMGRRKERGREGPGLPHHGALYEVTDFSVFGRFDALIMIQRLNMRKENAQVVQRKGKRQCPVCVRRHASSGGRHQGTAGSDRHAYTYLFVHRRGVHSGPASQSQRALRCCWSCQWSPWLVLLGSHLGQHAMKRAHRPTAYQPSQLRQTVEHLSPTVELGKTS